MNPLYPRLTPGSTLTRTASGPIPDPRPDIEEETPFDQARIEFLRYFQAYFFEQAQKAYEAEAQFGAFIVLCASIHSLASHVYDGEINSAEFKGFCKTFLSKYDCDALWVNLRCALFHRGAPGNKPDALGVILTQVAEDHDPDGSREVNRSSVTLAFDPFRNDLIAATNKMLSEAAGDERLEIAVRRTYAHYRVVASPAV